MADETRREAPEQELSELLQIRRDKLKALQEDGRDPFEITKFRRSAPRQAMVTPAISGTTAKAVSASRQFIRSIMNTMPSEFSTSITGRSTLFISTWNIVVLR